MRQQGLIPPRNRCRTDSRFGTSAITRFSTDSPSVPIRASSSKGRPFSSSYVALPAYTVSLLAALNLGGSLRENLEKTALRNSAIFASSDSHIVLAFVFAYGAPVVASTSWSHTSRAIASSQLDQLCCEEALAPPLTALALFPYRLAFFQLLRFFPLRFSDVSYEPA